MHQNNEENLNPVRTKDEARRRGENGGKASGEARRRKRDSRKLLEGILKSQPVINKATRDNLNALGIQGTGKDHDKYDLEMLATAALVQKAMSGNVKAYSLMLEILGEDARSKSARERMDFEREMMENMAASPAEVVDDGFIDAMREAAGDDIFEDEQDVPDHLEE